MIKIEAKFEIVTPMLHGAHQTKAEIRVPSIKGMLRFWWRAINYNSNIYELWEKDAFIFGSSDEKIGKSKVSIMLTENNTSTYYNKNPKPTGLDGEFKIRIDINEKQVDNTVYVYDEVVKVLKVVGLLGGIGSRSRRGYGSISIVELKTDNNTQWEVPTNKDQYITELKNLLSNSKNNVSLPSYTAFYSGTRIVVSKKTFLTEQIAFQEIKKEYKNYNKKNEGFGLPSNRRNRRASPLFFHIHHISGQYIWTCVFFKSKFQESKDMPPDNYKAVDDFITRLTTTKGEEVKF
ncbi:MAG: type III-B CRISPR module RAMP protein Cmr1 [Thermoplasmata archaeon]